MKKLRVIKFGAPWCLPCRMINPHIDELSDKFKNSKNISIELVNIDENEDLSSYYGIKAIPTILYIIDDKEVERTLGLVGKEQIEEKINNILEDVQ